MRIASYMPRRARIVLVDVPHHVTQRGNNNNLIFHDEMDRIKYLYWMNKYSTQHKTDILAYCLMSNHVHFICIPKKNISLAKTFNIAHMRYSQYFNEKYNLKGHLWQNRFYSCALDNRHTLAAVRYVERNPVRAGLIDNPDKWLWSSAGYHIGAVQPKINLIEAWNYLGISKKAWKEFIQIDEDKETIEKLREGTRMGLPYGEKEFVERVEAIVGRKLMIRKRGRPNLGGSTKKKGTAPYLFKKFYSVEFIK